MNKSLAVNVKYFYDLTFLCFRKSFLANDIILTSVLKTPAEVCREIFVHHSSEKQVFAWKNEEPNLGIWTQVAHICSNVIHRLC